MRWDRSGDGGNVSKRFTNFSTAHARKRESSFETADGLLLIVDFTFSFADPRAAVRFARGERVNVLVPRDVFQLLFVVRELVFRVCSELEVLCEQDGVNGTDFLTEATVDTLADVEVVLFAVSLFVHDDLYRVIRADVFALSTPDAALLAELVNTTEPGADLRWVIWILDGERRAIECVFHRRRHTLENSNHCVFVIVRVV